MKKILFITLVTSLFLTHFSFADDKEVSNVESKAFFKKAMDLPTATPTLPEDNINFSPYQQKKVDYYLFLVDMLTSKINLYNIQNQKKKDSELINKISDTQDKLTVAYEALTELFCMPDLYNTLEYKGSPTNSSCLKYLNEIEKRIPDSPIIPCVKYGIDDPECISKYEDQYFSTFDIASLSSDEINLKDKVEYQNKEQEIAKLKTSIEKNKEQYSYLINNKQTKSRDFLNIKTDLKKDYTKLLNLQCNIELTRVTHKKPEGITKFKIAPKENIADPEFYALLKTIPDKNQKKDDKTIKNSNSGTPSQNEREQIWRIRLINYDCKKSIDDALSMFNDFPYAVCAYYGRLTPKCIQAWRVYKTQLEKEKKELYKKTDKAGPGFATF